MILKCKMCGGTLNIEDKVGIATCPYCSTNQTLTKSDDEIIANLYNRANNLRLKNEFDKAEAIYEKIVEQDDSEAEAHWGIVLCKYGIEYVDDPATNKKIPTCHRTSYSSIISDIDYQAAIDYSDAKQQLIYESEARVIDNIQRNTLSIAKNEEPFDIFICYKETDENGNRTIDSVIANDIYYQLINEGFKVFFSAITLENKLGQEYEPYIFAALNSSKVMLVIGTKPKYINSVWVKNEWSRFLQLMKSNRNKLLIPCYKDMDAYDLPEEFSHLQAQDMSKIGFINDVVRGIKKLFYKNETIDEHIEPKNTTDNTTSISNLIKRSYISMEDNEFEKANQFLEDALNINPEEGEVYLAKLLCDLHLKSIKQLSSITIPIETNKNYKRAIQFLNNDDTRKFLISCNESIKNFSEKLTINRDLIIKGHEVEFGAMNFEKIKWIIIRVEKDEALLISKYIIDNKKYNDNSLDKNWKSCSLRTWLNNTFYENVFNISEKKLILNKEDSIIVSSSFLSHEYETIYDKVFLIDYNEICNFFASESERKSEIKTKIFEDKTSNTTVYGSYWISNTHTSEKANRTLNFINSEGMLDKKGLLPIEECGVRPAILISTNFPIE